MAGGSGNGGGYFGRKIGLSGRGERSEFEFEARIFNRREVGKKSKEFVEEFLSRNGRAGFRARGQPGMSGDPLNICLGGTRLGGERTGCHGIGEKSGGLLAVNVANRNRKVQQLVRQRFRELFRDLESPDLDRLNVWHARFGRRQGVSALLS